MTFNNDSIYLGRAIQNDFQESILINQIVFTPYYKENSFQTTPKMLLKAGFTVTILDIAVMAMGFLVAKLLHLTPTPSGVLVYALIGKFFYMIIVNTLSFSLANLFINAKEDFSRTTLLSLGLCIFTLLGILCFFGFNDNAHNFTTSIIANPLPVTAVFLPIIIAYATVYYFAMRADNRLKNA